MVGGGLSFTGSSKGAVINYGKIGAHSGDVVLIAAKVDNEGSITAANSDVGLLAGYQVVLKDQVDQDGKFAVNIGGAGTLVTNAGTIAAAAAELRAENGSIYAVAGNTQSLIRATEVSGLSDMAKVADRLSPFIFLDAGYGSERAIHRDVHPASTGAGADYQLGSTLSLNLTAAYALANGMQTKSGDARLEIGVTVTF